MKKNVLIAVILLLIGGGLRAQTLDSKFGIDSAATILNASIYAELFKQKNYEEALPPWRYLFFNAPAYQMNTYIRGEEMMKYMIAKTQKKEYIDTLFMVLDQRIKYFGKDARYPEGYVLGKKALYQMQFLDKTPENVKLIHTTAMKSIETQAAKVPTTLNIALESALLLTKENQMSKDDFINLYLQLDEILAKSEAENADRSKEMLDNTLFESGLADCQTLSDLLTKKYEENKTDIESLKEISKLLRRRECTELPLYATVAEAVYAIEPSSEAAYSLARLFLSRGDQPKSEQYIKEAISKTDNNEDKANYSMILARLYLSQGKYQQAKGMAAEAVRYTPNNGAAYIVIARCYAGAALTYSSDDFEKRSVYWAVVDKLNRAKQVDPSVASDANDLIKQYTQQFPSKEEGFFRSITEGATIKIGSWINETTTARFND